MQAFDIETGKFQLPAAPAPTFTNVFADALIDAAKGPARCGHYGGNADRSGLSKFEKEFPDRCSTSAFASSMP